MEEREKGGEEGVEREEGEEGIMVVKAYWVHSGSCAEEQVGVVMSLGVGGEPDTLHHQLHIELGLGDQL